MQRAKRKAIFSYKGLALKVMSLFVIVGMNTAGLSGIGYTAAYYNDSEFSPGSHLAATSLDFLLQPSEFESTGSSLNLGPGTTTTKTIGMVNVGNITDFKYKVTSGNFTGDQDFCDALMVHSELAGTQFSSGTSLSALLDGPTTTTDTWKFAFSVLGEYANSVCNFNFIYDGWQPTLPVFDNGYHDTEEATNTISSWGFRINKIYYDVFESEPEPEPNECSALSQGYWKNNEGCSNGTGTSAWAGDVSLLSDSFFDVFLDITGEGVCTTVDVSSCPSGNTAAGQRCRAKAHTLADELDVVSGKLDLNAIIAGADDGGAAFDTLGLSYFSTISEALSQVEAVIANASSTKNKLAKAAHVAERVYTFYEEENASAPMCLYAPTPDTGRGKEGDNEWVEVYNQTDIPLDLSEWEMCDNTSCDALPPSLTVPPFGFGVITGTSTTWGYWHVPADIIKIVLPDGKIGNGLHNDADMLLLKRSDGVIVDQMNYGTPDEGWGNYNDDVWNPGATDVIEGNVLARVPSGYDTDQREDFRELSPPVLDLIYPNEGDDSLTWYWTFPYDIEWTAENPNGDDGDLALDLYYIKDLNQNEVVDEGDTKHVIELDTPNDGSYTWEVPSGFIGYIWILLVATGPENPMLNDKAISGKIYDPIPPGLFDTNERAVVQAVLADMQDEGEEILEGEFSEPEIFVDDNNDNSDDNDGSAAPSTSLGTNSLGVSNDNSDDNSGTPSSSEGEDIAKETDDGVAIEEEGRIDEDSNDDNNDNNDHGANNSDDDINDDNNNPLTSSTSLETNNADEVVILEVIDLDQAEGTSTEEMVVDGENQNEAVILKVIDLDETEESATEETAGEDETVVLKVIDLDHREETTPEDNEDSTLLAEEVENGITEEGKELGENSENEETSSAGEDGADSPQAEEGERTEQDQGREGNSEEGKEGESGV